MDMKTKLINEQQLSQLNGEVFCAAFEKATRIVLQISSLNVPANINHFVEYEIPDNNFYKRAIWDPKYENKGNREYRALMVDLLDLIEKNEYKERIISSIKK
jgi:hypothetical protein